MPNRTAQPDLDLAEAYTEPLAEALVALAVVVEDSYSWADDRAARAGLRNMASALRRSYTLRRRLVRPLRDALRDAQAVMERGLEPSEECASHWGVFNAARDRAGEYEAALRLLGGDR